MSPDTYNAKILSTLEEIQRDVATIKARMGSAPVGTGTGGGVASDADLDSERGNPTIKKDPPKWSGDSFIGCRYSECSPEYLESLAGFLDWKADRPQAGKEKYADYDRRDAARCRGWAARIRAGHVQAMPPANDYGGGGATGTNDDIPFIFIEQRWDRP